MNRHERRREAALARAADKFRLDRAAIAADRAFFERRPDRSFYLRRAFPGEREAMLHTSPVPPSDDEAAFVAVAQRKRGRICAGFFGPRDLETDIGDAEVRELFACLMAEADSVSVVSSDPDLFVGIAEIIGAAR